MTQQQKQMKWWVPFLAGAAYGITMRIAFGMKHPELLASLASVMAAAFVIGVPIGIGAMTVHLAEKTGRRSVVFYITAPWGTTALATLGTAVGTLEGSICIALALPILLFNSSVGGLVYGLLCRKFIFPKATIHGVLVLPLALLLVEPYLPVPQEYISIKRSTVIGSTPESIWAEIINPQNIQVAEFSQGLAYKIGVPHPLDATLDKEEVGGIRKVRWDRGVHFLEEITAIEKNHHIGWRYHFSHDSFPPGSMDDHVQVGGRYFDLHHTSYTLTPMAQNTALEIVITYRVSTSFNWYAEPIVSLLMRDTADTLLEFYKHRAEAKN